METINTEVSQVNFDPKNTDAIAFNMQLSPLIINNRVIYTNFIDHLSLWGAFAGVLFSAFALFFLNFNKRKFYKRHPAWDNFK